MTRTQTTQVRDIQYWIDLILRRRNTALEVGSVVLAIAIVGTLIWPPLYSSAAKILVQNQRAQLLVSPNLQDKPQAQPAMVANPVTEQDLNSEREILTSTYLIRQALTALPEPESKTGPAAMLLKTMRLGLALPGIGYHAIHRTPVVSGHDQWALKLARHLTSAVIRRSNIIEVSFASRDPKWCQQFLEHLVAQYLEYHARISNDPRAEKFFAQQSALLKARLEVSEKKLRDFETQTGITSLQEQKQALITRLSDLQLQYEHTNADLASASQQVATLKDERQTTPRDIGQETDIVQNGALQGLKPQVLQLQAERAELLTRYQPTSRRIKEIDAKLAAAQQILSRETDLEVRERKTGLNPTWVAINSNLADAETRTAALKAAQTSLTKQIAANQAQLQSMADSGLVIDRLERQVATHKDALSSYLRKTEEARAAGALNLNKILNVSVAQEPNLPLEPTSPNLWLNMFAGLVLGIGFGLAAAFWEEQNDPRIYAAASIAQASDLPTLAVLHDES